jgi:hypothetical protein
VFRESCVQILTWRLKPSWVCSVCPGNCQELNLPRGHVTRVFFPHPFQFIIHYPSTTRSCTLSLTTCSGVLLGKLIVPHLAKILCISCYGTRRLITVLKTPYLLLLSWARSIRSVPPYSPTVRFIPLLPCHLSLVLPRGLFIEVSALKPCMYLFLRTHCELLID